MTLKKKGHSEIIRFWPSRFTAYHLRLFFPDTKKRMAILKIALLNGWIFQDKQGFYQKTEFCPDGLKSFPACFSFSHAKNEIGDDYATAIGFWVSSGSIQPDEKGEMFCKI